ncbi:hypothetical protein K439DRAFT_1302709, partial [Ramaria rubella]
YCRLTKAHPGTYLAKQLAACLRAYGIENKVLGLVADNASNNNTMLNGLEFELPGFQGSLTHVRCI